MSIAPNTEIFKYLFLMNGTVMISSLAENEGQALDRVKRLFGMEEKYEGMGYSFSHLTGNYSVKTEPKPIKKSKSIERKPEYSKPVSGEDLFTSVVNAYAKEKINL